MKKLKFEKQGSWMSAALLRLFGIIVALTLANFLKNHYKPWGNVIQQAELCIVYDQSGLQVNMIC